MKTSIIDRNIKTLTYLINLEGSDQRLKSATKQLNAANWSFERFPAYDGRGKALTEFEDYDDQKAREHLGRSLLSSEIGCYLSHYNCAQQFLKTDADYLIVLEDDMSLSPHFATVMPHILHCLARADSDQAKTHSTNALDWYLVNLAAKKKKLAKDIETFHQHSLWHAYYFPIRGLGLIWSRAGAKAFLAQGKPITMPVDIFFQRWLSGNGKGLGVWPALVSPRGLDSDILGTTSSQKIKRKDKEGRDFTYNAKKHKRMLQNKAAAIKHLYFNN